MTDEQHAAINEAHRRLVFCLIASSVKALHDRRSSYLTRREAQIFLKSELCVLFVRLLGLGESMTDQEIAYCLISSQNEVRYSNYTPETKGGQHDYDCKC